MESSNTAGAHVATLPQHTIFLPVVDVVERIAMNGGTMDVE